MTRLALLLMTTALSVALPGLAGAQTEEATETAAVAPAQAAEGETAEGETAVPEVLPAISVSAAETRDLVQRVLVSGLIGPVEEVRVAPLTEGQPIETLQADVGDRVTEGQVLATLSTTTLDLQQSQFVASLAAARASIAQAEAQLTGAEASAAEAQRVNDRTAALRAQGAASQAAADTARANAVSAGAQVNVARQSLEAARANLALVEAQQANVALNLARTEVVAPVAGEITVRNATLGSIATAAGEPMFTIVKDGALELRADVAEADLMLVEPGQRASLALVGRTEPLTGRIRLVEPTIDRTTRLGRLRVAIDDSTRVRAGMFAEAQIVAAEHTGIAVPVTAVSSTPDGDVVMRVNGDTVERVVVETGIRDGDWVGIIRGLDEGDIVVTKAGAFVRDGDRVNPVTAEMN